MITVVSQRRHFDCGVACLAMLCNVDYADAFYACAQVSKRKLRQGVTLRQLQQAARKLGRPLRLVHCRNVDLDEDIGILSLGWKGSKDGHAVYLRRGTIIEPDEHIRVWDADEYFKASKGVRLGHLLVEQVSEARGNSTACRVAKRKPKR